MFAGAGIIAAGAVAWAAISQSMTIANAESLSQLLERTHVHGLAVDLADPARLLIATHHGVYASTDGWVQEVSSNKDDFMGFSAHPHDEKVFFGSGHPADGGNLGVIRSDDGGRSWAQITAGANGPVDFHQMAVSAADPDVLYGIYGSLQRSDDGGTSWNVVGPPPDGTIAIAASTLDANMLYAGTDGGIVDSTDGGRSWQPGHIIAAPATALHMTRNGTLVAYMMGQGLLISAEDDFPHWRRDSDDLGEDPVLHLAVDPTDESRMFAATMRGRMLTSDDGGSSWRSMLSE